MRAAEFSATEVRLGGFEAPPAVPGGATRMSKGLVWLAVVGITGVLVLLGAGVAAVGSRLVPEAERVPAGGVSFIPAHGWQPVANPSGAPADAVTYGRQGGTFIVWSQPDGDAESVAKQVLATFFPAASASGKYLRQQTPNGIELRPEQHGADTQLSQVAVEPLHPPLAQKDRANQKEQTILAVTVWQGPPPAQQAHFDALWDDATAMAGTVDAREVQ